MELRPDLDAIEALSPEREALWARIDKATFLTPNEKRSAVGYGPLDPVSDPAGLPPSDSLSLKWPGQPRDAGRFNFGKDPNRAQPVARGPRPPPRPP